jgi:hypothetical protein
VKAFVGRLTEGEFLPELENGVCSCYVKKKLPLFDHAYKAS